MLASNSQHLNAEGVGNLRLPVGDGFLELSDVQYAPETEVNMISPGLLRHGGVAMYGHKDMLVSKGTGSTIAQYRCQVDVQHLDVKAPGMKNPVQRFNFAALSNNLITKQDDLDS